jgi:hypothetical protein
MTNTPPITPSNLTPGRHPGYLLLISEEETPEGWPMRDQSPTMYRWTFCLWPDPSCIPTTAPEVQTAVSSTKFSPKGKFQASKAYVWTSQLLGRQIAPGESVDYDTLYPVPCVCKVERDPGKDFAKITDVESWEEGRQYLTPDFKTLLLALATDDPEPEAPQPARTAPSAPAPPAPTPAPAAQTWGSAPAQPTPIPAPPSTSGGWNRG